MTFPKQKEGFLMNMKMFREAFLQTSKISQQMSENTTLLWVQKHVSCIMES